MSAHTPGPWKIDHNGDVWAKGANREHYLGRVQMSDESDAHLIATAPEMYRALEMNECLHPADGSYCDPNVGSCAARAAIAKAKGESK